jgi:uncharacterized Tic20 family protein
VVLQEVRSTYVETMGKTIFNLFRLLTIISSIIIIIIIIIKATTIIINNIIILILTMLSVLQEVRSTYVETMGKTIFNLFRLYHQELKKLVSEVRAAHRNSNETGAVHRYLVYTGCEELFRLYHQELKKLVSEVRAAHRNSNGTGAVHRYSA